MQLSKSTRKNSKKHRGQAPHERFQREWKRVQNLQVQNERLRAEVEAFAERVIEVIQPVEVAFLQAKYQLVEKLLRFAERKSLAQWQREELLDWIQQVLLDLSAHPFSSALDLSELYQKLSGHIDAYFGIDDNAEEIQDGFEDSNEKTEFDQILDDLFAEDEGTDYDADEFIGGLDKDDSQEKSLNQLLKASSINKMFRQIASAIHPDREKDTERKAQRNQLMSELARARDEKDIPKIFAMYSEHVGASPLEFIGEDVETVITLLKRQADRLRAEKANIIHGNPLHGAVYERFYDKSEKRVNAAINQYARDIKKETQAHVHMTGSITNLAHLKIVLEQREVINRLCLDEGFND